MLAQDAITGLGQVSTDHLYDDDPEWFDLVVSAYTLGEAELIEAVCEWLGGLVLRAFHGTRTANANSFFEHGIRLHDRAQLEAEVRRLIKQHESIAWLESTVDQRFAETAHLVDDGRCFVVIDERFLVGMCGHYLLGGSEFIQGIIGPGAAQKLLADCSPTIIEVDLPLSNVSFSQLSEFAKQLIGEWAKVLRRERSEARHIDFTFVLREPVPPAWVVGHCHPQIINDPHEFRRAVRIETPYCAACTKDADLGRQEAPPSGCTKFSI